MLGLVWSSVVFFHLLSRTQGTLKLAHWQAASANYCALLGNSVQTSFTVTMLGFGEELWQFSEFTSNAKTIKQQTFEISFILICSFLPHLNSGSSFVLDFN